MSSATTKHVNEAMNDQVAEKKPVATLDDIRKALPASDTLRYVKNDTYVADPTMILGKVYYENIGDKALIPFHTSIAASIDEKSILKAPQTISELIIDSKASAAADVLSYVSLSIAQDEVFELRVINNTSARLVDKGDQWDQALQKWLTNPLCQELINSKKVGLISIVTGVVQKYMTSKKYRKFEVGAKGGGFGVNVSGSLYTSSSEFQLDVLYGLDLVSFGGVDHINELAENIAQGLTLSKPADLRNARMLFDTMALQRASIFRLSGQ